MVLNKRRLFAALCTVAAMIATYSIAARLLLIRDIEACRDIQLRSDIHNQEDDEYLRIRGLCKDKSVDKLNDAVKMTANDIKLECKIDDAPSGIDTATRTANLYLTNLSKRKLLLFRTELVRLTVKSYEQQGVSVDDYTVGPRIPANGIDILSPSQQVKIPLTFELENNLRHTIKVNFTAPVWRKLAENESMLNLVAIATSECKF